MNKNIVIVNGTFSSGKTELSKVLVASLGEQGLNPNQILRLADGPHLVDIITTLSHGPEGAMPSSNHFHNWQDDPLKLHSHSGGEKHFPFTVLYPRVGKEMFRQTAFELLQKSREHNGLIIAELGTGIREGCQYSGADFSTSTFLETLEGNSIFDEFKERTKLVVPIESSWERRLKRNGIRPQFADGVEESWGMEQEGLKITKKNCGPQPWKEFGFPVARTFDNDKDGETAIKTYIEGQILPYLLEGQTILPEGQINPHKERF